MARSALYLVFSVAAQRLHYPIYDPRRAIGRTITSIIVGFAVGLPLAVRFSWPVAMLGGWNAGGLVLALLSWIRITSCDEHRTAKRAAAEDPGRRAVYLLVVLTSAASLLAATVLMRHSHHVAVGETTLLLALCLSTVILSWALTHTAFTLRYAHLYYREDAEGVGGIEFPGGGQPAYLDFAYLAFTVGMCFQVSDTTVCSRQIRTTVLFHAALSFFYNTAILAFVLNLVFGRAN
jgi:uncharacterized membrane protein